MNNQKGNPKINAGITVNEMDLIIRYIFTENRTITRKCLSATYELFNAMNPTTYTHNDRMRKRVEFIKTVLKAKLELKYVDNEIILSYAKKNDDLGEFVEKQVRPLMKMPLNSNDIEMVTDNLIGNRLKYYFMYLYKDDLSELLANFTTGEFESYGKITNDFKSIISVILREFRKTEINDTNNNSFSFSDLDSAIKIKETVERLKSPSNTLFSGIQLLNEILGGGFEATRVYTFMGTSGGFKSGLLLSICYWVALFNKDRVETKDPFKKPTVLYVTQENTVDETIERLFNMSVTSEDIRNFSPDEVSQMLIDNGQFTVKTDNFIDIDLRYFPNKRISTSSLYDVVEELNEEGKEVILLVHDYISRIKSSFNSPDPRLELGNVIDDFKILAQHYYIPVITAMQLNRTAASVIDCAMENNESDLARLLGRANVGESWKVIENSDLCIIINKEYSVTLEQWFLTFKRVKIRRKVTSDLTYFNHPFQIGNQMRLIPDIDGEMLSVTTLANDIVVGEVKDDTNAVSRPIMQSDKKSEKEFNDYFANKIVS